VFFRRIQVRRAAHISPGAPISSLPSGSLNSPLPLEDYAPFMFCSGGALRRSRPYFVGSSYGEQSMERDLWKSIVNALSRAPQRWPRNGCYSNRQILAVFFWAALHDRPISWACRRCNWPSAAWRRALPDQSTMSRRLRESALLGDIDDVRAHLQRTWPPGKRLLVDSEGHGAP